MDALCPPRIPRGTLPCITAAGSSSAIPWMGLQLWAKTAWLTGGSYRYDCYDYAFAITNNNARGQRVVEAAGGHVLI